MGDYEEDEEPLADASYQVLEHRGDAFDRAGARAVAAQ